MADPRLLANDSVGEGPAVVFIHGMTFSRRTWDPIVERLRSRFRCVTVDLPGHGDSGGSAADPLEIGERLHHTLAAIGVDAPLVIGHSAGALHATGYAANYPSVGVINVDQPLVITDFVTFLQGLADRLRGPDFESAFAPFEQSIGVNRLPEPERTRVADTRRLDQDLVLDSWTMPLTTPPNELQDRFDTMLDAITVPYLYLSGEEPPPALRDHLTAHLPNPEIVVWPGLGHLPHLAKPDAFADLVGAFSRATNSAGS